MIGLLVLVVPAKAALAQRGMGGGRGGGGGGAGMGRGGGEGRSEQSAPPTLDEKDVDKLSPVRVVLDKAKSLKLTTAQKAALDSSTTRYEWNIHLFVRRVDSASLAVREAQTAGRRGGGAQPDSGTASAPPESVGNPYRDALREALASIRRERDSTEAMVLRHLDDSQKAKVVPDLGESREKLEGLLVKIEFPGGRGGAPY
jgi:hypothetical protein